MAFVAAKQLGRKAIGIEIEERYCEIAAVRVMRAARNIADLPPQMGLWDQPEVRPSTDDEMRLLGWQDDLKEEAVQDGIRRATMAQEGPQEPA